MAIKAKEGILSFSWSWKLNYWHLSGWALGFIPVALLVFEIYLRVSAGQGFGLGFGSIIGKLLVLVFGWIVGALVYQANSLERLEAYGEFIVGTFICVLILSADLFWQPSGTFAEVSNGAVVDDEQSNSVIVYPTNHVYRFDDEFNITVTVGNETYDLTFETTGTGTELYKRYTNNAALYENTRTAVQFSAIGTRSLVPENTRPHKLMATFLSQLDRQLESMPVRLIKYECN